MGYLNSVRRQGISARQKTAHALFALIVLFLSIVVKSVETSTPPVISTPSTNFENAYNVKENIAYSGVFYAIDSQTLTEDLDFEAGPLPFFGSVATPISSVSCEELTSPLKTGNTIACPCNQYEDCGLFVYTPNPLHYGYDYFELTAKDTNGDVSQSTAKIYVYIEPVNNRPTLACEAPSTTADVLISGTSDSLRGLSEFASSDPALGHPLCRNPITVRKAALDSLEDVRVRTREVLTYADGFVPASLSGPDGFFAKLLTLLNSFETRAAGEIPLMLATRKAHDWDIPMGGATERASMDICAGLGNDKTSCVADDGCQWLGTSGACVSASWGSPDHVVEVAIALVSYDMDEESGFEARVSGAPDFPSKSGGFLSEPELLAPLFNDAEIDTDVQIFVANPDGSKGAELSWTGETEGQTILGGVIIVRMPSKRRGTVVLRWRATDTEGLKQPVAPDYAEVKLNTQCTPGHRYMNWWWDTSRCFACSPGWHNQGDVYDQTSCQECLPGSVADVSGKTRCDKCPVGTFQPRYGQSVCLQCYDGTGLEIQTEQDGSSSIEQCVCPAGRFTDYMETSTSDLWSLYKASSNPMQSYYATEVSGVSETYGVGSIYIDILSHTEFTEIANDAVVPKDDANKYVPLKDLNEDAVKCVGHVKQTCAGLMTAGLSEASLANGVCNPALNVPECGWDCGDCCKDSCLSTAIRDNLRDDLPVFSWSTATDCPPNRGDYNSCVDPRFAEQEASVYKSNPDAPLCLECQPGSECTNLNSGISALNGLLGLISVSVVAFVLV